MVTKNNGFHYRLDELLISIMYFQLSNIPTTKIIQPKHLYTRSSEKKKTNIIKYNIYFKTLHFFLFYLGKMFYKEYHLFV